MADTTALVGEERTPVFVLTGFLGSGKTTLLRALLEHEDMRDTAVIVNEFGEVGLDHLLVREVTEEVVLLASGCICCTVRDDVASTLEDLDAKRAAGTIPPFSRVVVETTGLADPAPLIQTLAGSRGLAARFRMAGLTASVDAQLGRSALDSHMEAVKQSALADCLVLTKTDLAMPIEVQALEARLRRLNANARIEQSAPGRFPAPELLFDPAGSIDPAAADRQPASGLDLSYVRATKTRRHDDRIGSFTVRIREPLDWPLFAEWLELLLASRGASLLRLKGLVHVTGRERPVVVQCVQHMVYPPAELRAWPDGEPETRLVFITRDFTRTAAVTSLREILGDTFTLM
jgi:G3E family GTPase